MGLGPVTVIRSPPMRLLSPILCGCALTIATGAAAESKLTFLDLQPKGNHKLDDRLGDFDGNNLASVPRDEQILAGSPFKIGAKMIQLRGGEAVPDLPEKVEGIKVDAAFDKL